MTKLTTSAALVMAFGALTACGGGGGGGGDDGGGGGAVPDYVEFTNNSVSVDSALGGQTLLVDGTPVIRPMSGSLRHDTRALTNLTDGSRTINDPDGDVAGTWTEGDLTFEPDSGAPSQEFSAYYRFTELGGDASSGVIGVLIDAGDVPTTAGDTIYNGTARFDGTHDPSGSPVSLSGTGTSQVTVDFGSNTVDLEVSTISSTLLFDTLEITGMTIDGGSRNAFGGGTLSLSKNATDVTGTVLGTVSTEDAQGNFFGFDDVTGNPSDVGGVFVSEGTSGEVFGAFLAD